MNPFTYESALSLVNDDKQQYRRDEDLIKYLCDALLVPVPGDVRYSSLSNIDYSVGGVRNVLLLAGKGK